MIENLSTNTLQTSMSITFQRAASTARSSSDYRRQDDLNKTSEERKEISNEYLPYSIAVIIEEKSPNSTRSAASFATSEPLPIAMPQSAALRDGASLTPSPVTATQFPKLRKELTMRNFCSGVVRAKTISSYWHSWYSWGAVMVRRSVPVMMMLFNA